MRRAHPVSAPTRLPGSMRSSTVPGAQARPSPSARETGAHATPSRASGRRPSRALILLSLGCGMAVAAVMLLGNPVLWTTAEQHAAAGYAQGTDTEDFAFIDGIAGNLDTSQMAALGEYKAISQDGNPDRAANIALAAEELDGTEIKPGETFSVNAALGDTAQDERYRVAGVVNGTAIAEERGGGVCQASTALYIAAIKAGMEIVERHPHTVACDYAPIGLDATLAYGQKDLRIKNATDASMFVRATALGQTVEVKLYGASGRDGETIDAVSNIVDRYVVPASEVYDDPATQGMAPEDSITYYATESYRVRYRDGMKVSDELLAADVYQVHVEPSALHGEGEG